MRLARVEFQGDERTAIIAADGELQILPQSSGNVLELLSAEAPPQAESTVPAASVRFLTPVRPAKILCVGLNYRDHAEESAREVPEHPSLFARFPDSVVGHENPIVAPSVSEQYDYEGELAVVMGKPCWRIGPGEALDHVAGYSCFAENSVRDFQQHSRQATAGKNFYASGAFGPVVATPDEIGELENAVVETRLNGATVQMARLSSLIYTVPEIISYISQFTPLRPGDVIATGTPSGVGAARNPPLWLKRGDRLEVEVTGIGTLSNTVVADGPETAPFGGARQ